LRRAGGGGTMIHPTAIIHPKAQLDPTVTVGPYAVIDGEVTVGPNCVLGPHVYLTGITQIGANNQFHAGCVVGGMPQDLKYKGKPTRLRVGDFNTFREGVTVNRATEPDEDTVIGSHNLLMACCHVGHNCQIGNHVIIANGALLAGHVSVGDRAVLSGTCLLHQFTRVGTLAMMQGGSAITKDLPPYTVARGYSGICGLNIIGLRRAGMAAEERLELKKLYRVLFRSGQNISAALASARGQFSTPAAKNMIEFVASAKRGVCADRGRSGGEEEAEVEL
jgi:UDP-N-acetylglucosamine acyltransferase